MGEMVKEGEGGVERTLHLTQIFYGPRVMHHTQDTGGLATMLWMA